MESPVRICIGAVIVVNLLLLCGTAVDGGTIPQETTTNARKDERTPRLRLNNTWPTRGKPRTPDVSLNELNPKEATSEEHTEKQNAKYKDRGRVRFGSQIKITTNSPLRRSRASTTTTFAPTEASTLIIITPTPEVKKPLQIIDSMRNFKKTKLPSTISSTNPMSVKIESQSIEEFENKEETEDSDSFEKFISTKFHDNNFFTIPSFEDGDDFKHDSDNESSNNKVKQDFSSPSYSFSSYFPKDDTYSYKEDSDPFKSSFFDFDTELTTPKNDFFDKRFEQISTSIIKNLDSIKAKSPQPNITNVHKIVKENIGLERLSNNTPSNKSTVFLKNTKEIRLSDNQGAGSANKELSDVQGTSIYYEMSVLSTETYAINHSNDDDCDNDTPSVEATQSTSPQEELVAIKATQPTPVVETTKQIESQTTPEVLTTYSSNFFPISSVKPLYNAFDVVPISTQNHVPTTERITRLFSSSFTRNRNYSKRLNLTGTKDSPNSVTAKTDLPLNTARLPVRKFYTQPKTTKPIWLSPRRNITRVFTRPTVPTTIYSEHFNIKDKFTPSNLRQTSKSMLTTVPSAEIDPVLQSDVSGIKKVVHSQSISDNTIPSLRKRGSNRFTTSSSTSSEKETELSDLEIPSTAWALAGLISPPSLPHSVVNATENELQKVGDIMDKKEATISSTTTTTPSPISNDIFTKKVTEVDQNKLLWQPAYSTASQNVDQMTSNETKSDNLSSESTASESNVEVVTTEAVKNNSIESESKIKENVIEPNAKPKEVRPLWIPAMAKETTTVTLEKDNKDKTIPPVDGTKSTGFESITKLPADITTPIDETVAGSEVNQTISEEKPTVTTDNYEITTIRFSYVPTETEETITDDESPAVETTTWHLAMPTRIKLTTIEDSPITTYRPKYMTTTDIEETTTIISDTTPVLEVSSQIIENVTEKLPETTTALKTTTEEMTEPTTTTEVVTEPPTTVPISVPTTTSTAATRSTVTTTTTTTEPPTTTPTTEIPEDTTTVVVEVVTEINTEKATIITPEPTTEQTSETTEPDCTSEENSDSNEIIHDTKTTETEEATTETAETVENSHANIIVTTPRVETTTAQPTRPTTTVPVIRVETTEPSNIVELTTDKITTEDSETTTHRDDELEDLTSYAGVTTEASSQVTQGLPEEAGAGAAVAIAVSTIGVIALILLIGLLLVVRRRGRRGIYAQRCTPVSLDAYSLDSVSVGHRKGNHRLRASKRSYGNPAYDDEVTSHPMQYPALASFALDVDSMTAEFAEIPAVSARPEDVPPGCEDKNRYSNVLPLPETRVPLRRIGNDPTTEYINANYVTGPGNIRNYYILSQAPMSNTVIDFWRMVWEQNSRLIVMLTEYMENGVEKCFEYLPPSEISDNKRTFGEFQIILKKREQRDKYAISSVQVINLTTRTWREVTQLWYFWPAKGVPEDYDSVIDFLFEMRSYMKVAQTAKEYDEEGVEVIYGDQNRSSFNNLSKFREDSGSGNGVNVYSPAKAEEQMRRGYANNGTLSRMKAASEVDGIRPCIVTCASGAGRSAAVCALDICARALLAGSCDVPRVVRLLRTQRPHSLSNRHHYMFVYKVLSEYGNKTMGGGDTI